MGGRKRLLTAQQARVVKTMWDSREHTRHEIAAHFTVSVATIDRVLRASRIVAAGRSRSKPTTGRPKTLHAPQSLTCKFGLFI